MQAELELAGWVGSFGGSRYNFDSRELKRVKGELTRGEGQRQGQWPKSAGLLPEISLAGGWGGTSVAVTVFKEPI
jgi:hypothetical protein